MARPRAAIIGAGRMGQGLGLALQRRGYAPVLVARSARSVAGTLLLHVGHPAEPVRQAEFVLIATPDAAITDVAQQLAEENAVGREHTVLHLSGLLDRRALSPLEGSAAALGSFHPLQTVAEPGTAADRLQGSYVGIEGDPRALDAAERLAKTLRMTPVRIQAEAKPAYHAAAVMIANYVTALVGLAERVATAAGVPAEIASKLYLPLLSGAAQNLATLPPMEALTGPVRRGDTATVKAHLDALPPAERRLYALLGLEALGMAREAGLEAGAVQELEKIFRAAAK